MAASYDRRRTGTDGPEVPSVVGLNPFRPQPRRRSDYVMVAAALTAIAVMLLWALIPR